MAPKKLPLTRSSAFVRIRPVTTTGDCAHTLGNAVSKKLSGWNATTVQVKDDDRRMTHNFGNFTAVIPPEMENEEAFNTMLPELVDAFKSDSNILFFAYGQTGSGKTHTMLGEIASLSSPVPMPGWGILPRVVHSTLESMHEWRAAGVQSVLLASAVEFYCSGGFDLSSASKSPVEIDRDAQVFGVQSTELTSPEQLQDWIMRMYANRVTAKTNMNDASSRSHCAFILTLHQLHADSMYVKTSFSLIDMAGSERHSKAGGERVSGMEAGMEAWKMYLAGTPEKLSIGAQGTLINCELTYIATEILKAAEMHEKGMPFRAQKEMSTAASFYFSACCDGRARLGVCVTLSQSPQHGFESWFSLRYAQQLAQCRAPHIKVEPIPMDEALLAATRAAEEAADHFARTNKNPQGPKQWRCFQLVQGCAHHTSDTLATMERLALEAGGGAGVVAMELPSGAGCRALLLDGEPAP